MMPAYHQGQYVLANKLMFRLQTLSRGDVVIYHTPLNSAYHIGRIIGLPGEAIVIQNGHILVNNQILAEPYIGNTVKTYAGKYLLEGKQVTMPSSQYVILVDNRGSGVDSRDLGFIPQSMIISKVGF